jgi:small multidrug resistance family-3 protein
MIWLLGGRDSLRPSASRRTILHTVDCSPVGRPVPREYQIHNGLVRRDEKRVDAIPMSPHWTPLTVLQSGVLFFVAGIGEIGGGWLVWQYMRARKPWWWALLGAVALISYGFVTTLQPEAAGSDFGRIDAAYGGIFIAMSFLWGRIVDGMRLDLGDLIGSILCLAGIVVILSWPRSPGKCGRAPPDNVTNTTVALSLSENATYCTNSSATTVG